MKNETWQKLDELFARAPRFRCGPVSAAEIETAQSAVGIPLGSDYKEFIMRYGGAIVGAIPIYGLRKAHPMGNDEGSFVEMTRFYRNGEWPEAKQWVIFSSDQAGNPIGLDRDGKVWIIDQELPSVENIADSFEEYLLVFCLDFSDY